MSKAVLIALAVSVSVLSGCSTVENIFGPNEAAQKNAQVQRRLGQLTIDLNSCSTKRKSDPLITHVAYATCVNAAFQSAMIDVSYPYPDIVATLSADRLRVAEQADKGEITDVEGLARIDDKISEVVRLDLARTYDSDLANTQTQYFLQLMQTGI